MGNMFNPIRFWRELKYTPHPARLLHNTRKLIMDSNQESLFMHHDKQVCAMLNYDGVDEEERNRYFNEYTVTNVVLLMLLLDEAALQTDDELRKNYLQKWREYVPKFYLDYLEELKIEERNIYLWDKLIDLRYEEYQREILNWRRELINVNEELAQEIVHDKFVLAYQAVTLGLFQHLRRQKGKPKDPLYLRLQSYLVPIFKRMMKKIF